MAESLWRVTETEVEAILDYDDSISLSPFIDAANELVTELCTDSSYSDSRLEEIEKWLSAHFYHIRDQHVSQERAGEVGVNYQYKVDLFFSQTKYGQMAMVLDTKGNIAQLQKRLKEGEASTITLSWLGLDYDDPAESPYYTDD